jgi:hypothetical protein
MDSFALAIKQEKKTADYADVTDVFQGAAASAALPIRESVNPLCSFSLF